MTETPKESAKLKQKKRIKQENPPLLLQTPEGSKPRPK